MENYLAFSRMNLLNPENCIILYCETLELLLKSGYIQGWDSTSASELTQGKTRQSFPLKRTFDNTNLRIASTNNSMLAPKLNLLLPSGKEYSIHQTALKYKEKKQQDQRNKYRKISKVFINQ